MIKILNFDSDDQLLTKIQNAKNRSDLNKIFRYCKKKIKYSLAKTIIQLNYKPLYYIYDKKIIPFNNQDELFNYNLVIDYILNGMIRIFPRILILSLPKHHIFVAGMKEKFFAEFYNFLCSNPDIYYDSLGPIIDKLCHEYLKTNLSFSAPFWKNSKLLNFTVKSDSDHSLETLFRFGYGVYNQTSFTFNYPSHKL